MENTDESDMRSQPLGIGRDFEHGCRARAEEQVVQDAGVVSAECIQFVRQREYDVKVSNRKQFALPRGNPPPASLRLALWTMTIPAGNGELSITCVMGSNF
jgi:hypothetical protein